jgi:hypothetical protein
MTRYRVSMDIGGTFTDVVTRVPACSGGDVCSMMGLGVNPGNVEPWLEATSDPGDEFPMFIEFYGYRTDSGGGATT